MSCMFLDRLHLELRNIVNINSLKNIERLSWWSCMANANWCIWCLLCVLPVVMIICCCEANSKSCSTEYTCARHQYSTQLQISNKNSSYNGSFCSTVWSNYEWFI